MTMLTMNELKSYSVIPTSSRIYYVPSDLILKENICDDMPLVKLHGIIKPKN